MDKVIEDLKVKTIQTHGSVHPTVPKKLTVQTAGLVFLPDNEEVLNFLNFCTSLTSLQILWIMKIADGVLAPWGVAITNAKQVTLPKDGSIHMQ